MSDVSPKQGQASLAVPSVTAEPAPYLHQHSRPNLYSQFRGPFPVMMAETDEEKAKREEEERKQEEKRKEDEKAKSNFAKVKEAREKAEAERDALLEEKRQREEADKKAAEAKLEEDKEFEKLAKQREAEATTAKEEAAAAKAEAEEAKSKLKKIEEQQEAELTKILETIPEEKRPPLDETDSVEKRLAQVRYAQTLLTPPKPPVGTGQRNESGDTKGRFQELKEAEKIRPLTEDETFELMSLNGEE